MINLTVEGFEQDSLINRLRAEIYASAEKGANEPRMGCNGHAHPAGQGDSGDPEEGVALSHHESVRRRRPVA